MVSKNLGPKRRLIHRWQFLSFFKGAEVFKLGPCIVFRIPNNLKHFRVGITIKTKCTSIERTRVKRVVRESMRAMAEQLKGFDYNVLIPSGSKLMYPFPKRLATALKGLPKCF